MTENIIHEIQKVVLGKKEVVEKVMMAVIANGHILLDDVPGVGKTTLAVAFSRVMGLAFNRVQFTPDVLPSDIVGFSLYDRESGKFIYMPGVVINANFLLVDEINRASSRTQAALLEAMEEGQVTVDGQMHPLKNPFLVIATQNQVGTAGTHTLPQAQLDRFLVQLSIGYPDFESQMNIIRDRAVSNPLDLLTQVCTLEDVIWMQTQAMNVTMKDEIIRYITELSVYSRESELIELGISPRGAIAISRMARACAYVRGRDYVIPEDVQEVFYDVCRHRIILSHRARNNDMKTLDVLREVVKNVKVPYVNK